jgi:hypothetical protein
MEMIMNKSIDLNQFKIDQIGYVYRDIQKQAKLLEESLKLPKFSFLENRDTPYEYRGKPTIISTKLAFSRTLSTQIELIQHISGDCIFKEFLDEKRREGLHHFGIFVDQLNPIIDYYKKEGFEIVHSGLTAGRQKVAYLDTYDLLGVYLEFQETIKRRKK